MTKQELSYEEQVTQLEIELQHARNSINEYKKEQEDFIMIASHDLQAPLRKLSTFVERLLYKFKAWNGNEANEYVDRIEATVTSMRKMIDNLSKFAVVLEPGDLLNQCDLNEIVRDIIKDMSQDFGEKNPVINYSGLPTVQGNCAQLKSLFENVITNAFKFQKSNSPLLLNITTAAVSEEEKIVSGLNSNIAYHKIEISDNGIGFDDQYSKKIFQPFTRLHGKSEYEGNGLGLALCKKIAENHHGLISAKSVEGQGTRFILILPATRH